ncbi:Primase (primpol) - superfamily 3 helicase [Saccharolobus shibatae B12]|uniref:Primase (Primpol)-superfamily 3 helicase n=1 Tax=Saccharolobus shibatae (strain ATCC 51178 / DSM 5389 / JCM 8931 / NBRC 15437 / B12) TaxID=523848 RepID=A0A8F5BM36_SACSH|nr:hypothetical protein [Saccharolobus shibatae]QXJ27815.1 Primase (primpol) - superfamily 3 helicase [Saccharolobus shibatae B12]
MKTAEFLKQLWDVPGYYVIGVQLNSGKWQWFTTTPEGAEKILERYRETANVYYGVNPRAEDPKGKKGSDADIKEANVLFADFDFKERKDCKPGIYKEDPNTGELELCYDENGKTVYVHRPPYEELLKDLEERGISKPNFIVDSGNGYHFLWKLEKPYGVQKWKEIEAELIDRLKDLGVDPQAKDPSRVLRLPGSINHRSGRECRVLYISSGRVRVTESKYEDIIQDVLPCFKKAEDRRFEFVGHFSGYLARRGVPQEDAEKIVEELYDRAGIPPEHVKDVKYTYKDYSKGGHVTGLPELQKLCEELGAHINLKLLGKKKKDPEGADTEPGKEQLITSFDTLRIYHDFQHGKAYVSTYKAIREMVKRKVGKTEIEVPEKVVKIDKTFVNEGGKIKVLTEEDLESLNDEYLHVENLHVKVEMYPKLNLPTEIIEDVKISDVYKEVLEFVRQRVDTLRLEDQVTITVWTIATYFAPVFKFFPYLAPMKLGYNSGGSQLLETLSYIVPRPAMISSPTPASVYRMQDDFQPTMLIDELRNNINKDTFNALYDILVAGYKRGVQIPRVGKDQDVMYFEPFGPKAIIDQSLITAQYDIASRCLFIRLIRNTNRISSYTIEKPQDLINKLHSVFLIYSPTVYSLYYNINSGYTGRYDQVYRPLITIARLIDKEDESLRVEEQLKIVLNDSMEFSESLAIEGDPQKKVYSLVVEYIKGSLSLRNFFEGKSTEVHEPWHKKEEGDEVYIFLSDLRKKITEYAVEMYQKDISYRYDEGGKSAVSEREWEKVDPQLAEFLNNSKFIEILQKFFPDKTVRRHRDRYALFLNSESYSKIISLNFSESPSRVAVENKEGGKTRDSYNSQSSDKNTNPSNLTPLRSPGDSYSDSEIKIQNKGSEKENTKPRVELKEQMTLQNSNKNSESETTTPTHPRLDSDSQKKSLSRNYSKEGVEKNSATQGLTAKQQKILDLLKKLRKRVGGVMPLAELSKEELKLLPELKEIGYINFNNINVWLTVEGLIDVEEFTMNYIKSKLMKYDEVDDATLNKILEITVSAREKRFWKDVLKLRGIIEEVGEGKWRVRN